MPRVVWAALAALVAIRIAIPLAALAAEGSALPGLPHYEYDPLVGDANDYYAAARELISTTAREPWIPASSVVLVAAGMVAGRWISQRRTELAWLRLILPLLAASVGVAVLVSFLQGAGAGTVGWPLVWAAVLAPIRLADVLDPDSAFAAGLALSLVLNAVTVVATAAIGRRATGSWRVGVGAAALFALWPLFARGIAGSEAWENGTWHVDVGLNLYGEPLSTALVAIACVLLLGRLDPTSLATAGALIGFATATRLSNVVLAALAVALVAGWHRDRRASLPLVAGAAAFVPLVAAYWPHGYLSRERELIDGPLFAIDNVVRSWRDSLVFDPTTLIVLAPLAVIGALAVSRRARHLAATFVLATAVFYSFYAPTWEHPRFLFVVLPLLFVLEAAGVAALLPAQLSKRLAEQPRPGSFGRG